MAGQGTIALEMLEEVPDLDVLVVPIGGGGLIAGNAIAAQAIRPAIEIVGVECALYPSMWNAVHGGNKPCGGATLAEGIAVSRAGKLALPVVRELVREIILVDEPLIERAVNIFLTLQKTMAEGAGAGEDFRWSPSVGANLQSLASLLAVCGRTWRLVHWPSFCLGFWGGRDVVNRR